METNLKEIRQKIQLELKEAGSFLKEFTEKGQSIKSLYEEIVFKRDNSEEFEAGKMAGLKFALSLLDKTLDK